MAYNVYLFIQVQHIGLNYFGCKSKTAHFIHFKQKEEYILLFCQFQ